MPQSDLCKTSSRATSIRRFGSRSPKMYKHGPPVSAWGPVIRYPAAGGGMVVGIWRHTTTCAVSSGAHSGQERNSRISGKNERHTVNGALMRPKVLHELHASRTFLPELEVPVRGPGQQELVAGGHCNTGDHVAVHEAALVHGRRWQARQVCCFMRQHLRPRTEDGWRSPYSLYARCGQALTHACKTSQAVIPDCSKSGRAHRPSQAQFLYIAGCRSPHKPVP